MNALKVYLRLYRECVRRSMASIGKNPWTLLLPSAVLLAREWAGQLAAPLGIVGGILVSLATAALASSYLYFVGELVQGGRVSLKELQRSFGAYLWSIVNVLFVVWIASLALQLFLGGAPQGAAILYALWVVALVALNAVPEVIYLRGTHGGMQTVAASWDFLKAQWIPWFAVNVPVLAAVGFVGALVPVPILGELVVGAALHVAMVFRGNLFRALDGSSHRQRMFARRIA